MSSAPVPFEIVALQPRGTAAGNGDLNVCLPDGDGKMFRRRAIKGVGSGNPRAEEWLVVELDGVRVYVNARNIVVTKRDLNP